MAFLLLGAEAAEVVLAAGEVRQLLSCFNACRSLQEQFSPLLLVQAEPLEVLDPVGLQELLVPLEPQGERAGLLLLTR